MEKNSEGLLRSLLWEILMAFDNVNIRLSSSEYRQISNKSISQKFRRIAA